MSSFKSTISSVEHGHYSLTVLRERWITAYKCDPPKAARTDYLVRALAFHEQSKATGGVTPSLQKRIAKLGSPAVDSASKVKRKLHAGARLLREWKGETHDVEVNDVGYRYAGENYSSLSEIARLITGTRWSGPLFFGLKTKPTASARQRAAPKYVVDLSSKATTGSSPHGR